MKSRKKRGERRADWRGNVERYGAVKIGLKWAEMGVLCFMRELDKEYQIIIKYNIV